MQRAMSWAYIAGFFDADGSITLKDKNRFRPSVSFHNNDRGILDAIHDFILRKLKIRGYFYTYEPSNPKHNTQYTLSYNGIENVNELGKRIKCLHQKKINRFRVVRAASKITLPSLRRKLIERFYGKQNVEESGVAHAAPSTLKA